MAFSWKHPERRTNEDRLLLNYWREVGGVIFTEVPIGRNGPREWPPSAKGRRIDGVRLVAPPPGLSDGIHAFARDTTRRWIGFFIASARVEVIEVNKT